MPLPERGTPEWISEVNRIDGTLKAMYAGAKARYGFGDQGTIILHDSTTSERFFTLIDVGPVISSAGNWELGMVISPPIVLKVDASIKDMLDGSMGRENSTTPVVGNSPIREELCRQYQFVDGGDGHVTLRRQDSPPIEFYTSDQPGS